MLPLGAMNSKLQTLLILLGSVAAVSNRLITRTSR